METGTFEQATNANATAGLPALHALAVAPAVGSIVLLFVAVGIMAMAVGACSGLAGDRHTRRPGRREAR